MRGRIKLNFLLTPFSYFDILISIFLDLSKVKPDFLVLSFYKLFGYPTGDILKVGTI